MTERWDGIPDNSESEGLHYVGDAVAFWHVGKWAIIGHSKFLSPEELAAEFWAIYHGPCPDHPRVAAILEAQRKRDGVQK